MLLGEKLCVSSYTREPSKAQRWQWNNTVVPLTSRPGRRRQGDLGYINTDGLELYEYLTWCEDIGAEPIMAVWDSYSLDGQSVAQGDPQPYIQQAFDQVSGSDLTMNQRCF
ncbi:hypothetical protein K435DRAFT_671722 [Dendrothele bispora CBS 962.96]|uniref:Alpha-L-arabinofuranosidase 1 catalytic domain-containing protein n=1 Tax=Dendrothele bispora (strain CBS 962.96) TaxID=1314807 RepID=A0A4S8LT22_DENBC|nr:hypothetical protein K435DRAFT_671722 [Dendrothele bispora CBS 962.96]